MALVREYAQSNSEQAFATLVSRHVNLVYSVALRQVSDHHLAEEISQAVFVILARKGKSLSPKTILSGWLCRTARNISADTLKIQRRRQFREQEAHMESILNEPEPGVWNQIAPLLDEALNCLGEKEHDAVVLRFFDGKELKHVGAVMGTSEDAARMRVNRGIDKLREFFAKKGVTLSATAIAGAVAANSVQAAPAGLAASITAAALSGTAITTTSVIAATKTIAMTTLQKAIVSATIAVLAGAGIYEARQASITRSQLLTFQQGQIVPSDDIQKPTQERDDAAGRLLAAREENQRLARDTAELLKLRREVGVLRMQFAEKSQQVGIQERNATPGIQNRQEDPLVRDIRDITKVGGFPDDPDPALDALLSKGPRVMPDLARLLQRGEFIEERIKAADAMCAIAYDNPNAPEVRDAVPVLLTVAQKGDSEVRFRAVQALGAIGQGASDAAPVLIQLTKDLNASVRMSAVEALGRIGADSPESVAALRVALSDDSDDVKITAKQALEIVQRGHK